MTQPINPDAVDPAPGVPCEKDPRCGLATGHTGSCEIDEQPDGEES